MGVRARQLAAPAGSPCALPPFHRPPYSPSPLYPSALTQDPTHLPLPAPAQAVPTMPPLGALLILGGPPTSSGAHHACIISPEGDFLLEHVTAGVCHTHFPVSLLTPAALDTLLYLLETPPYCCSKRRLHSAYRGLGPPPRCPPATTPPASPQGTTSFPPFPASLPPDVYRAPPLSTVLEGKKSDFLH